MNNLNLKKWLIEKLSVQSLADKVFDNITGRALDMLFDYFLEVDKKITDIGRKIDTMMGEPYKSGVSHLNDALNANNSSNRAVFINDARKSFITASNFNMPLEGKVSCYFMTGVCNELLLENGNALSWYKKALNELKQKLDYCIDKHGSHNKDTPSLLLLGGALASIVFPVVGIPMAIGGVAKGFNDKSVREKIVSEYLKYMNLMLKIARYCGNRKWIDNEFSNYLNNLFIYQDFETVLGIENDEGGSSQYPDIGGYW